jgi:hypothetical protein
MDVMLYYNICYNFLEFHSNSLKFTFAFRSFLQVIKTIVFSGFVNAICHLMEPSMNKIFVEKEAHTRKV